MENLIKKIVKSVDWTNVIVEGLSLAELDRLNQIKEKKASDNDK